MKAIRVKNLRSLENTGDIYLKPLTFLLGENSSGKSTFLRLLPMLKQSVESRTKGPLLWYGRYVDFGSFKEAVGNYTKDDTMTIGFVLSLVNDFKLSSFPMRTPKSQLFDADIEIKLGEGGNGTFAFTQECTLKMFDSHVFIRFDESQKIVEFTTDEFNFTKTVTGYTTGNRNLGTGSNIIPVPYDSARNSQSFVRNTVQINTLFNILSASIRKHLHSGVSSENVIRIINNITLGDSATILSSLKTSNVSLIRWTRRVEGWTIETPAFIEVKEMYIAWAAQQVLFMADNYISNYLANLRYIAPLRATAERYYRFQDLDANEIDFQGRNLALVLQNFSHSQKVSFESWTRENFNFAVMVRPSGGHSAVIIREVGVEKEVSLADMGFGFSQVIPILVQLWLASSNKTRPLTYAHRSIDVTFAIEQPELHLHPRMQAKLADVLYKTINLSKQNGISLKLIIETHSETIINRIGLRIAGEQISKDDVSIVIFEKFNPAEPSKVRIVDYDSDGLLMDWPLGFFDPEII